MVRLRSTHCSNGVTRVRRVVVRRRLATPWIVATITFSGALSSCTTYLQPTTCDRAPRSPTGKQQGTTACGGIHDARFCDYVAVAVEGADW